MKNVEHQKMFNIVQNIMLIFRDVQHQLFCFDGIKQNTSFCVTFFSSSCNFAYQNLLSIISANTPKPFKPFFEETWEILPNSYNYDGFAGWKILQCHTQDLICFKLTKKNSNFFSCLRVEQLVARLIQNIHLRMIWI